MDDENKNSEPRREDHQRHHHVTCKEYLAEEIDDYVNILVLRPDKFPMGAIKAYKQRAHCSIDTPIGEALKSEACWLCQAASKTAAVKRFNISSEQGLEHAIDN
ncbi:hypothetical protein NBRC116594_41820 [Shimia sp. NS0008-38b]|uniref:hypothetical protein n=1 Tax=Shimia sp. NS0008-38b TaxID=3127653 RepID=UPI003109A803